MSSNKSELDESKEIKVEIQPFDDNQKEKTLITKENL